MPAELTPNAVLVRRSVYVTLASLGLLLILAVTSVLVGDELVLAIETANALERAERYEQEGDLRTAASEYYRLLELRPGDADVRAALCELQLRRGLAAEGLAEAKQLVAGASTDPVRDLWLYGDALAASGDFAGAEAAYSEAMKTGLERPEALYGLGVVSGLQNRMQDAREYFSRLRALPNPEFSREYRRSMRDGEAIERKIDEGAAITDLKNHELAALVEWKLKNGHLDDALSLYKGAPHQLRGNRSPAIAAVRTLADGAK